MNFAAYMRSHALRLAASLILLAALGALLLPLGVSTDGTILILIIAVILEAVPFLWGYARSRQYMHNLEVLADEGPDTLAYARSIEEPSYPEGELSWQAMQSLARAAQADSHEAEAAVEEYRQYVETWVHEIKTPLAAVRLMLANADAPDTAAVSREIARIDSYVEQALYYARSTSVEKDYLVRSVPADSLVKEAVRSRARTLIEAHMAVDMSGLTVQDGTSPVLICDPKWMDFILGQLIDNAVKYRQAKNPQISFSARIEEAGTANEHAVLKVADNGCGISEADLPRIFERGFTGENGRSHGKATGMGLYLVRTLCQKMGLSVSVRSREGKGTAFEIAFPQERSRFEEGTKLTEL
ncbi:MAG: sensor histidine kinase [Olsenella sp.]|jgi:signal transduction histidine kinase